MILLEIIVIIKRHFHVCLREILCALREYYAARKYGLRYVEGVFDRKPTPSMYGDSEGYGGSAQIHFNKVLDYLDITQHDVFVDLGCGRGRVVFFAALRKPRQVIGIELVKEYADRARDDARLLSTRLGVPIEIIHADAAKYRVDEGTIYYLYHPFGVSTLTSAIERIRESLAVNPRQVRIVYYNPVYELVLEKTDWLVRTKHFTSRSCTGEVTISVWESKLTAVADTKNNSVPLTPATEVLRITK